MSVVTEFHKAFGLPAPRSPQTAPRDALTLRIVLIEEEVREVKAELYKLAYVPLTPDEQIEALRSLLKELCDLRYVTEGAAVTLGLDIDEAYREVHRSNMSKLNRCPVCGGIEPEFCSGPCHGSGRVALRRADGKVLKGSEYTEADMEPFVPGIIEGSVEE